MDLILKIANELKEAMKSGNTEKVGVLRLINSALKNKSIEKRGRGQSEELTDEDVLEVLSREAKKRKESSEAFLKGDRQDLVDKEKAELAIIESYMPKQMSREEIKAAVEKILSGITDKSNFGLVMKVMLQELKGKGDAKTISEIVKEKLG